MSTFLELAGEDPPARKKTFLDLAELPKTPDATSSDVIGGTFLQQSPATQASVIANVDRKGPPATFNGQPLDSLRAATPQETPVKIDLKGMAPEPAPVVPWLQRASGDVASKIGAGVQAGLNTAGGVVGGGLGLAYGGLEAAGSNAVDVLSGRKPGMDTEQQALLRAGQFTPTLPTAMQTPLGQEYTGNVGDFMREHGGSLVGIGPQISALGGVIKGAAANRSSMASLQDAFAAKQAAERIDPSLPKPRYTLVNGQPQEIAAGAIAAPAQPASVDLKFSDTAPISDAGPLSKGEQARRTQVLASVGLDQARKSSLTGNGKDAATEGQMAKLDNPAGNAMRAQLDAEKAALANHAETLVKNTGGTQGLDQSTLFSRGNTMVSPLDALKDHFDAQTSALYKAADARAQGIPAKMPATQAYIGGDRAEFLGTTEGEQLLKGIRARMTSLGMADADGVPSPATVQQAEQLKQYLNNQWQPRTARLIRGMKDAIDDDVTKAAGDDVYQQARQMRAQRAATLDNPNGIARVMDSSGPDGINRAVPVEKIPDAIAGMPVKQFGHIVETLQGVPTEIQPQATAALSEIKAHFANKVQAIGTSQAGQWNAKGVTKFLNNNSERMNLVFTPEEMADFRNLNDAGHILAKDQSYPGAAVQGHNLVRAGVTGGLTAAGTAAGTAMGGPMGGAAGGWLGAKAGNAINDAASLRAAQKRLTPLRAVGQ